MAIKEMDPDLARKLLEGQVDVLTPLTQKENEVFSSVACPHCSSSEVQVFVNRAAPFSKGSPLPNKLMKCLGCEAEFNPRNGIITSPPISHERG